MDMNALMGMLRGHSGGMFAGGSPSFREGPIGAPIYDAPGAGGAQPPNIPAPMPDAPQTMPVQPVQQGGNFMQQLMGMMQGRGQRQPRFPNSAMQGSLGGVGSGSVGAGGNPLMMLMQMLRGARGR